jgi:murein DD-endopeptidase MepM/ murein hydrolase activator NlpD
LNGVAPDVAAPSPNTPKQALVAEREARQIVVQAGQSLSRIAAKYDMPQRAIIAANDLTPPYKIKIGQQLLIPSADGPPTAPAAVGSPPPGVISVDRPALRESAAPPPTAGPAPSPDVPAVKPFEVAAPTGDKSPELLRAPVIPVPATTGGPPASSGPAELPAPATTAAASARTSVPAAAPPGVTCPSGTIGMWSVDIIKVPVYICRKPQSQS